MLVSRHAENKTEGSNQIRFLTFNLPCFPIVCCKRPNADCLPESNLDRAESFVKQISSLSTEKQYDVICLQEIWEVETADYLQKEMKNTFPFQLRGPNTSSLIPNVTAGLLVFSRHPILDSKLEIFDNPMYGEEYFGKKGYFAFKIADKYSSEFFDTIITTHLHSEGAFIKKASIFWGGTAAFRRGMQMLAIHQGSQSWAKIPVSSLKPRHTVLLGDLNTELDCQIEGDVVDARKWLGVSLDGTVNFGQYQLLRHYEPSVPENYAFHSSAQQGFYIGTFNEGRNASRPIQFLIDGITLRKDGPEIGQLKTRILSFNSAKKAISDHFAVEGELNLILPFVQRKSQYESSKPIKIPGVNPACGMWHSFWKVSYEQYKLFPRTGQDFRPGDRENESKFENSKALIKF